ncbi:MAG: 16S rRNA (cytosine(1402)-N(4))-methyltransferase RsmH [Candidatus Pacearchaeota archaeon]|jgi:16S rRNA (cytosine1402-N4)-methyltransferase
MKFSHISIMPNEVLEAFSDLKKESIIVDGTLGKGGHSKLLLERGFHIIGTDRDKDAIEEVKKNLKNKNIKIFHDNFSDIKKVLKKTKVNLVSGILLDLGVSTYQLENKERGFGFAGKLDMRMNQQQKTTAEEIVNDYDEKTLSRIFKKYGEKVYYKEIAKNIIKKRKEKRITSGEELVEVIKMSMPHRYRKTRKHHWATPVFRALRIEVNRDFENLEKFLNDFKDCLESGGILCIITFHSLEERIIKTKIKLLKKQGVRLVTKKGIIATEQEIRKNPKAKRAKLWIAIKK